ncbi:MAG: acyl-CoA synthetase (NDP forming) [Gammaproteobacteria bacterium]|jgi:acyl-CoA synthetase (NDP forming)
MTHRLDAMFEARSMAIVGASARPGSFGSELATSAISNNYNGTINFINPRGGNILGHEAVPSISDLDQPPDVAVLGIAARNLERALLDAIDIGAKSAVIFDACYGETENGVTILQRLKDIAREANLPICGGAGMGFLNNHTGAVASFYPADHMKPGSISLIAHSGSVFTVLGMNDPRFRFDLMVSPGQEIGATVDEYITYAANRNTTNIIAVFMETARNPEGLVESLCTARDAGVPVVICKVGRTEHSARLARSHTGALVGSHTAYETVFSECGAISVNTVDELMNTALLFSSGRIPGSGGAGLVTDSGGLREMLLDIAVESNTPLAQLSDQTIFKLRNLLPPELVPSNPLDCAAALTDNFPKVFDNGLQTLADAEEVSMLGFEADMRDDYVYDKALSDLAKSLASRTEKPVFCYTSFGQTNNREIGSHLADLGIPCLNGADITMSAIRHLQNWANQRNIMPQRPTHITPLKLFPGNFSGEAASLQLLSEYQVPVAQSRVCVDMRAVNLAAKELGFPLVLKTAEPGKDHKSDQGGVVLNLMNFTSLQDAYIEMSTRIGAQVILQQQSAKGIELAFGCVIDADFGPLVMVSAGGILVEFFNEREFARAPFGPEKAEDMIRKLAVAKLIDGARGESPRDMAAAALALSSFSYACASLMEHVVEIDINPIIITETGAIAVDALIVANAGLQK